MDFLLPGKTKECMYLNFQAFYRQVKYGNFTRNILIISQLFLKRWHSNFEENYRILGNELNWTCQNAPSFLMPIVWSFPSWRSISPIISCWTSRSGRSWVLQKRYNDFVHLHEELKKSKCLWLTDSLRWPRGWSGLYASRVSQGVGDTRTTVIEMVSRPFKMIWVVGFLDEVVSSEDWAREWEDLLYLIASRTREQHIVIGDRTWQDLPTNGRFASPEDLGTESPSWQGELQSLEDACRVSQIAVV